MIIPPVCHPERSITESKDLLEFNYPFRLSEWSVAHGEICVFIIFFGYIGNIYLYFYASDFGGPL